MFLLALFIAMGTTLFSCADKNGNKQKIDKVEVVEDSTKINNITVGVGLPPKTDPNDTLHTIPPLKNIKPTPPTKNEEVELIESFTTGDIAVVPSPEEETPIVVDSMKTK